MQNELKAHRYSQQSVQTNKRQNKRKVNKAKKDRVLLKPDHTSPMNEIEQNHTQRQNGQVKEMKHQIPQQENEFIDQWPVLTKKTKSKLQKYKVDPDSQIQLSKVIEAIYRAFLAMLISLGQMLLMMYLCQPGLMKTFNKDQVLANKQMLYNFLHLIPLLQEIIKPVFVISICLFVVSKSIIFYKKFTNSHIIYQISESLLCKDRMRAEKENIGRKPSCLAKCFICLSQTSKFFYQNCGHMVCGNNCILSWLKKQKTSCPICREQSDHLIQIKQVQNNGDREQTSLRMYQSCNKYKIIS